MMAWPESQVQAVNGPAPKTWNDYRQGCLSTFGGGHAGVEYLAFQHGMNTVFNLLEHEFPPAEECKAVASCKAEGERLERALEVAESRVRDLESRLTEATELSGLRAATIRLLEAKARVAAMEGGVVARHKSADPVERVIEAMEGKELRTNVAPGDDVWVWDSDKRCAKQCVVQAVDIYGFVELMFHGVPSGNWRLGRWHKTREAAETSIEAMERRE